MSGFEARLDPIPAIGEHTDKVLAELGFGAGEIAALHASNTV